MSANTEITVGSTCLYTWQQPSIKEEGGLRFLVKVTDTRTHFGRVEFEIVPLRGDGTDWVTAEKLEVK